MKEAPFNGRCLKSCRKLAIAREESTRATKGGGGGQLRPPARYRARPPDGAAAGEILEYSWERRVARRRLPLRPSVPPVSVRQKQQWNFNFGFASGARHCTAARCLLMICRGRR